MAIRRNGARFSVTAPVTAAIRTAIAAIPENASPSTSRKDGTANANG